MHRLRFFVVDSYRFRLEKAGLGEHEGVVASLQFLLEIVREVERLA